MRRDPPTPHPRAVLARALLLVLALAGAGAARPTALAAQRAPRISGRVVDARSGDAIPDVVVRLEEARRSVLTDGDGRFFLTAPEVDSVTLTFRHAAHVDLQVRVPVGPDAPTEIELEALVFALEPIDVEVLRPQTAARLASGGATRVITRRDIEAQIGFSNSLADLIRRRVASFRVRETRDATDNPLGREICLEFRAAGARSLADPSICRSPLIIVDGVRLSEETTALQSLPLEAIEEIEVLSPGEAGARYGSGSDKGVILITTRRGAVSPYAPRQSFDWSLDPAGHPRWRALGTSALGYGLGLAAGLAIGMTCFDTTPTQDIVSSCGTAGDLGAALALLAAPSLGAAIGARLGGATEISRGRFVPALATAAVTLLPGYVFAAKGSPSNGAEAMGRVFLAVSVPIAVTVIDGVFRSLR